MAAPRPRELGVNSKAAGTMAMPPGVEINGAFYGNAPSLHRGKHAGNKKDRTAERKDKKPTDGKKQQSPFDDPGVIVWYAAEKGRTCALIKSTAVIADENKWKHLKNVHELYVEDEDEALRALPADFGTLRHLRVLSIRFTKLKMLVQNMESLPVTHASFSQNKLTSVAGVETMTKLTILDISFNLLQSIPENIDNLRSLKELILNGNKLRTLPDQIGNLKNLKDLHISSNRLTVLPDSLCGLTKLRTLDASMNALRELPAQLGSLSQLTQLIVSCNKLVSLPSTLQQCTSLRYLFMRQNHLREIPGFFKYLPCLEILNAQNNEIVDFKSPIGCLKTLLLDGNKLNEIPSPLFGCRSLEVLTLQGNDIDDLSVKIKELSKLRMLYLGHNKLQDIPQEICELKEMRHLMLQNNRIKVLPRDMHQMKNLTLFQTDMDQLEPSWASAYRRGLPSLKEYARTAPNYQEINGQGPHKSVVSTLKRQNSNGTFDRKDQQRASGRNKENGTRQNGDINQNIHPENSPRVSRYNRDRTNKSTRTGGGKGDIYNGPTVVKVK